MIGEVVSVVVLADWCSTRCWPGWGEALIQMGVGTGVTLAGAYDVLISDAPGSRRAEFRFLDLGGRGAGEVAISGGRFLAGLMGLGT